ncbi:MAG: hypothetical protein EZS28_038111 [Streblomastix strix]|uniref:Uncharacterized protein n=1 Tax=Streblomastix strix TaxID=222440 RepID=A0A5J4U820_9EUKA|nr:MAG: hypothetical protein EZS28_038111 [Streblomastix strix]
MVMFLETIYNIAAISFLDLRGLDQKRAQVALVDYCVSAVHCASPNFSAQKSICDVSCPESPAKSVCAAVIAFGGTSSGVAIVCSGSSGSISKFWWNAFTNVGCGCATTCSGFLRYQVHVIRCLV